MAPLEFSRVNQRCILKQCLYPSIQFDRAVRLFGEDNSTIQPDDFFAIFDSFLTSLNEARQDNENFRRRKEEEERRVKQEAEVNIL